MPLETHQIEISELTLHLNIDSTNFSDAPMKKHRWARPRLAFKIEPEECRRLPRNSCVGSWDRLPWMDGLKTAGVGQEGNSGMQSPQRDQRCGFDRCESPMTGSPPLGPGYMTDTKHHCRIGHGTQTGCSILRNIPLPPTRALSTPVHRDSFGHGRANLWIGGVSSWEG
jgi:hypothetical protein